MLPADYPMRCNGVIASIEHITQDETEIKILTGNNNEYQTIHFHSTLAKEYLGRSIQYQGVELYSKIGVQRLYFPADLHKGLLEQEMNIQYTKSIFGKLTTK